jgi:hypothetical protein
MLGLRAFGAAGHAAVQTLRVRALFNLGSFTAALGLLGVIGGWLNSLRIEHRTFFICH